MPGIYSFEGRITSLRGPLPLSLASNHNRYRVMTPWLPFLRFTFIAPIFSLPTFVIPAGLRQLLMEVKGISLVSLEGSLGSSHAMNQAIHLNSCLFHCQTSIYCNGSRNSDLWSNKPLSANILDACHTLISPADVGILHFTGSSP